MKKLFSAVIIVMMIALAGTLVVSAAEVYPKNAKGLYDIEYALAGTVEDGTQFGMVVIESTDDNETFDLDEDTIRYIDQVGAADGELVFDTFAPMDLKYGGTYKVYIGGGDLGEATFIGTLSTETPATPTVKTVTIDQVAPTVEVDKTITLTATVVDADAEYTLEWSSDATDVATVDAATGVVTGVKAGTANITVKAAEGVTATVAVTVSEAAVDAVLGDINGDGVVTIDDATYLFGYTMRPTRYPIDSYAGHVDFNRDGVITIDDATYLFGYTMRPTRYPISWE